MVCSKLHIFKVYNWVSADKSIWSWKHQFSQDNDHTPRSFLVTLCDHHFSKLPLICFLSLQISLLFLEFHVNAIIQSVLFFSQLSLYSSFCCGCLVNKLCLTLCNPMDCSMPGFPVLHYLPEFPQTHVHWFYDAILPSHPMTQLFASRGRSIGASASASALPMNIHGWFPLGLIGLISLLSEGLSRIFSSNTVRKHQFFRAPLPLWSNSGMPTLLLFSIIILRCIRVVPCIHGSVFSFLSAIPLYEYKLFIHPAVEE